MAVKIKIMSLLDEVTQQAPYNIVNPVPSTQAYSSSSWAHQSSIYQPGPSIPREGPAMHALASPNYSDDSSNVFDLYE